MLLQRLVEYGRNSSTVPPPYYKTQTVRWALELHADGSLAASQLTSLADPSNRALKNGAPHTIPSITKTSGIAPKIAVDTPEYLFGWCSEGVKPHRVEAAHTAFKELNRAWIAAEPAGPAKALAAFWENGHATRVTTQEPWSRGDLVAVRIDGEFLYDTDSAKRFWATVAAERKTSGVRGLCLVCGRTGDLLKTMPQQLPSRLVPQATQSASLISVNKATHGFDLTEQLVHVPVCAVCGLLAMSSLEGLLGEQWTSARAGQDARLAWWVTGGNEFDLTVLDQPTPDRVRALLNSAATGRHPAAPASGEWDTFCAIAIGGNVSRVVVRDWIERPLPHIQRNLINWFDDHEVVDRWTGEVQPVSLGRLATAAGRWIAGEGDRGAYAKFGASGEDRPDGIQQALWRSALLAKPLPPKLLAHLVHRVRADGRLDTARLALIRLALRRRNPTNREAYMPTLNPHNHEPSYLAGRVFAVLEDIQLSAARANGDEAPGTTFTDRYFARAVTSPAVALVAGRRDARAWLRRMRARQPGWAYVAEQRLDELFTQIAEAGGMPHGVVLADQAAFILGYHHQRAELFRDRAERAKNKTAESADEGALA